MGAQPKPYLTIEDYLDLERKSEQRHEFLDGELLAISGGTFAHSRLQANLIVELSSLLRSRPCVVNTADMRVKCEATGLYTYPDVSVVCGEPKFETERRDTLLNPRLIVEVLSPSTEAYDRGAKFQHYRQVTSLQEYVLVSQSHVRVERFLRTAEGEWSLRQVDGLDASIYLASLDVNLRLADLYHKVELVPPASHTVG
jgi:Uma2 family endonuclease